MKCSFLIMVMCLCVLSSCNEASHAPAPKAKSSVAASDEATTTQTDRAPKGIPVVETFMVAKESTVKNIPVNILISVSNVHQLRHERLDNYDRDYTEYVRNGVKALSDSLVAASYDHVKVKVVSCFNSDDIDLSIQSPNHCLNPSSVHSTIDHLNYRVTNDWGLKVPYWLLLKKSVYDLATSTDPEAPLSAKQKKLFAIDGTPVEVDRRNMKYIQNLLQVSAIPGSLSKDVSETEVVDRPEALFSLGDFFDPEHTNIVVYANNRDLDPKDKEDFLKIMTLNYGSTQSIRYYGIVQHRQGFVNRGTSELGYFPMPNHESLARELGGKLYMLTKDLAQYAHLFKKFAQDVKSTSVQNTFNLSYDCVGVEYVELDEKKLDATVYTCRGKELRVNQDALRDAEKIKIQYLKPAS